MAVSQFNLITATHSLESSGLSRAQAERITGTIQQVMEALVSNLATKADLTVSQSATQAALKAVQADIATHRAEMKDMATKADLAALKAELFRALWLQSIGILTGVGVLLTMFRMF